MWEDFNVTYLEVFCKIFSCYELQKKKTNAESIALLNKARENRNFSILFIGLRPENDDLICSDYIRFGPGAMRCAFFSCGLCGSKGAKGIA